MSEWQPIETAPKDGTPVLVWFRGRAHVAEYCAIWHPDNLRWAVRQPATGLEDNERIVADISKPTWGDGRPILGGHDGPTLWQPINPPKDSGNELIERLEKATEGSRELDGAIWWFKRAMVVYSNASTGIPLRSLPDKMPEGLGKLAVELAAPKFSRSIDAALTLVPEGARWDIQQDRTAAFASIDGETTGRCATPALALCIAALKARSA